jgi:hypothetical protein
MAQIWIAMCMAVLASLFPEQVLARGATAEELFRQGCEAYMAGGFEQSAKFFGEAAAVAPASGTLHNLGNAEWQSGRPGPAILAWERAHWLNPFDLDTRINLRFGRKAAQIDAPDLAWYEVCSAWLPVNVWGWIGCVSFWLAVAMIALPAALRWRRADWHQGVAAAGFAVFLLTIPAICGVHTRSDLGIVLARDTPLRLTPTSEAQVLGRIPAGEMVRRERVRGGYVFVRNGSASGWIHTDQFGLISGGLD